MTILIEMIKRHPVAIVFWIKSGLLLLKPYCQTDKLSS